MLQQQADYRAGADLIAQLWLAAHLDQLDQLGEKATFIDLAASVDVRATDPLDLPREWLRHYETPSSFANDAADVAAGYELLQVAYAMDPAIAELRPFNGSVWESTEGWLQSCAEGYRRVADSIEQALGSQSVTDDWRMLLGGLSDIASCDQWRSSLGSP